MNIINKTLIISSLNNLFLSIIKILFGVICKCGALIADGIHSLSDLSTDAVAIMGSHMSNKPADKKHPFGHGKIEYMTSIVIGIVVIVLGLFLVFNSVDKEIVVPSIIAVYVSLFTIIAKYIVAKYVYKNGIKYNNNILIASGIESKADVYSSICVLISILLMQLSNRFEILKYADMIGTIVVALLIIKVGFNILKDNSSLLLGEQTTDEYIEEIKNIILDFDVVSISNIYILKYGPYYKLIADITLDKSITLNEAHEIVNTIEDKIKIIRPEIKYIFIHMEPSS